VVELGIPKEAMRLRVKCPVCGYWAYDSTFRREHPFKAAMMRGLGYGKGFVFLPVLWETVRDKIAPLFKEALHRAVIALGGEIKWLGEEVEEEKVRAELLVAQSMASLSVLKMESSSLENNVSQWERTKRATLKLNTTPTVVKVESETILMGW